MTETRVAALAEVPPGQPRLVVVNGARLVLVRIGDEVHALDDVCAHQGGPLSEGKLTGTRLACPWHAWMYDVRTGKCLFPPRGNAVPSYRTRVEGDDVWVETSSTDDPSPPSAPSSPGDTSSSSDPRGPGPAGHDGGA